MLAASFVNFIINKKKTNIYNKKRLEKLSISIFICFFVHFNFNFTLTFIVFFFFKLCFNITT